MTQALVIRSGAIAFPRPPDSEGVEIVETVSHTVEPLPSSLEALSEPAALAVFTSQIAVRLLMENSETVARFRECLAGGQVAAVGDATAESLARYGVAVSIVAAGSGASVIERLPRRLDGWRVLLPRGEDATLDLPEALAGRGARLAPMVLYRKAPVAFDAALDAKIAGGRFAAFCPTSPAAARWLFAGAGDAAMSRLREMPAVVLGRFTGRYLGSHGVARVEVAPEATFASALSRLVSLARRGSPA
ncbi:MAG: uroporphyrinogen-III synthase [Acidobacteriota bacterium]|nr:uroporphyrinogen-III synthase [Acidobacteriota bacterium]